MSEKLFNPNIVPSNFTLREKHCESVLQKDLRDFFFLNNIPEIETPIESNIFFSFDLLGVPAYSPVRSRKNVIYTEKDRRDGGDEYIKEYGEDVSKIHLERFGISPNIEEMGQWLLTSHTTAGLVEHIFKNGPANIFTISKVFREKKEKREKTQVEIALINQSIPQVFSFMEKLYAHLLLQPSEIGITSDFYYFLEPSFSFKLRQQDTYIPFGSAGYMRESTLNIVRNKTSAPVESIIFIGIPYLKLLNLRIGLPYNEFDLDYNFPSHQLRNWSHRFP